MSEADHVMHPGYAEPAPDLADSAAARANLPERLALLDSPAFFLDSPELPAWLGVWHGQVELYAQPFATGLACGPRRFLAALPVGAVFPRQQPHAHWRLCVVPGAAGSIDGFDWPAAPEAAQTTLSALSPLIEALQGANPDIPPPPLDRLAPGRDPWLLLQAWMRLCFSGLSERRQPLPLAETEAANVAARQSAMQKMLHVLSNRILADSGDHASLASLAAEVARAQSLSLNKGAEQAQEGESLQDWARRAGVRLRRVALREHWWQTAGVPLLGVLRQDDDSGHGGSQGGGQGGGHGGGQGDGSTVGSSCNAPQHARKVVALLPTLKDGYSWRSPATEPVLMNAELAAQLSSFAYSVHGRLPERSLHVGDLLAFGWRAALADGLLLLLASLCSGLLGAVSPVAVAYVFKTVIPSSELALLAGFTTLIALLALVSGLLHLSADLAALRIEGRLGNGLQSAMFDRLLRLPLRFYASLTSGDLANRIAVIDNVRRSFSTMIVLIATSFFYTLGAFLTMLYFMPKAALLALALMLLVWLVAGLTGWRQVKTLYEGEQIEGNIIAMVVQLLQGITKLRLAGAEDRGFGLWGRGFAEMRTRLTRGRKLQVHLSAFIATAEVVLSAMVFAVLGYGEGEKPTTSEFLALVAALATFSASGLSVGQAISRLIMIKPFFERIRPILKASPEATSQGQEVSHMNGAIEVLRLSFGYHPDAPPVLRDVSFQVRPGQFVAIVGSSGCGKSTLFRLLLGFEQANSGGIYYDGHDFQTLNAESVRRQIGVVLQNGRSMPGSLFENISVAHECTLDEAWQAARLAGLEDDIRAMPMGMHTILSEGNAALSGGQVQRLLLARALAGQPQILFLDEATSALDNRTQAWVSASLANMAMTRLVIAHRLSTVQQADLILVMHDGEIAERGTYAELMALDGHFARLARRQLA